VELVEETKVGVKEGKIVNNYRHLNKEGQEWKIGHHKGRALMGREGKEGSKESVYGWCTFCLRMNIEF
jgi:hypothetical protein